MSVGQFEPQLRRQRNHFTGPSEPQQSLPVCCLTISMPMSVQYRCAAWAVSALVAKSSDLIGRIVYWDPKNWAGFENAANSSSETIQLLWKTTLCVHLRRPLDIWSTSLHMWSVILQAKNVTRTYEGQSPLDTQEIISYSSATIGPNQTAYQDKPTYRNRGWWLRLALQSELLAVSELPCTPLYSRVSWRSVVRMLVLFKHVTDPELNFGLNWATQQECDCKHKLQEMNK